jgi:hypothetical protein
MSDFSVYRFKDFMTMSSETTIGAEVSDTGSVGHVDGYINFLIHVSFYAEGQLAKLLTWG